MKVTNKYIYVIFTFLILLTNITFAQEGLELMPSGEVVFIEAECKYPFVSNKLKLNAQTLELGDMIKSINNVSLENISKIPIIESFMKKSNEILNLNIKRKNEEMNIKISSDELRNYKLDYSMQGLGTITAINKDGTFYGLSHGIHINKTEIEIEKSHIYTTTYVQEKKSKKYNVGCLVANKGEEKIGEITDNNEYGINGKIINSNYLNNTELETSKPQVGKAWILCVAPVTNEKTLHEINITEVNNDVSEVEVIDENLIKNRGGLVRGMSGSPVIQNNKIVGGVRSIYPSNPKKGIISNINSMTNNKTLN